MKLITYARIISMHMKLASLNVTLTQHTFGLKPKLFNHRTFNKNLGMGATYFNPPC